MNILKKFNLRENQYQYFEVFVVIILSIIGAIVLNVLLSLSFRWTLYVFGSPIFLLLLFKIEKPLYQITTVVFALIFIEKTIIRRQYPSDYSFLGIGISVIVALIILYSFIKNKLTGYGIENYIKLFLILFLALLISVFIGGFGRRVLMIENIRILVQYYLEFILFFYMGYLAFHNASDIKKFIFYMIIFSIMIASYHVIALSFGVNIESIRGSVSASRNVAEVWRYGGFFKNVNNLCAFNTMFIPVAILFLYYNKAKYKKIISAISAMIMFISVLFGGSRAGLGFSVINSMIILFFLKIDLKKVIVVILVLGIFFIVINIFISQFFPDLFGRSYGRMLRKGLDSPRYLLWTHTLQIIIDYPLGLGLSGMNFLRVILRYSNIYLDNPHNIYLHMATQAGIIGLIVFLTIIIKTIKIIIRAYREIKDPLSKEVLSYFLVMISGFLLMGLTEPVFMNSIKMNHLFAIIIGASNSFSYRLLKK